MKTLSMIGKQSGATGRKAIVPMRGAFATVFGAMRGRIFSTAPAK
ncbi:hypothetical protein [Lysobacter fragariae]